MKASVQVMKAAGFLALDWKHLSVAQAQIKIVDCCRARVISRTLFSGLRIPFCAGTLWVFPGIAAYWDRMGAALGQGRTADGAPDLAESRAVLCAHRLRKARGRYLDLIPPLEKSQSMGKFIARHQSMIGPRRDLVRMVR